MGKINTIKTKKIVVAGKLPSESTVDTPHIIYLSIECDPAADSCCLYQGFFSSRFLGSFNPPSI